MAGEVALTQCADMIATTFQKISPTKFWNELIGQSYIFQMFLQSLKPKNMSGKKLEFRAMLKGDADDSDDIDGEPGVYGAYETLGGTATEYLVTGEIPWCFYHTYWILSSQEMRLNQGEEGFVNLVDEKFEGCTTRLANVMERHFWSRTSYLHESAAKPWLLGPCYWLTDDGYHINDSGGSSGTLVANIDPTTSDYNDPVGSRNRWRNQASTAPTINDLPDYLDDMFVDTKFQAPPKVDMMNTPQFKRFKIVFHKTLWKQYKRLQKRLRDNIGADLASGEMVFNNLSLDFADRIPDRTTATEYEAFFFNLNTWKAFVESGNNWRKDEPIKPSNQDARLQRLYVWPAIVCEARRHNGKIVVTSSDVVEG